MEDYASNSHKSKNELQPGPSSRKAIAKSSGLRKRSEFSKFMNLFISKDARSIGEYVVKDVLVPSIKEGLKSTVDFIFDTSDTGIRFSSPNSRYRNYNKITERKSSESARNVYDYEDPLFDSEESAVMVLEELDDVMDKNRVVSVMDLFVAAGQPCDYTYDNYGWTDIRSAKIASFRGKWYIKMPKPMPLSRR